MPPVTRDLLRSYLNTTPAATATYALIGEGFTALTESLNPSTSSRTFIHEKSATEDITGYAPVFDYTAEKYSGDPVIDFISELGESRATGADALTDIVNVHFNEAGVTEGTYVAYQQKVAVRVDQINGGNAPAVQPVTGSFLYQGEPVKGEWNPTTSTFTADA